MTATPGADERRARLNLLRVLDGARPTPPPPPLPPAGEGERTRDWLDEILDDRPAPPPAAPRLPDWRRREPLLDASRKPVDVPEPDADEDDLDDEPAGGWEDVGQPPEPATKPGTVPVPRPAAPAVRRAHAAYAGLPARVRVLLYTGSAAGAGWALGAEPLFGGWIAACGHDTSTGGALALGTGLITATAVLVDRRTRGWWPPLAWACRIPLASALLALALYAPGATT
ncbi:hypothetical protein ACWERV_16975 [Streptomyces sp. NPDC004031]